MKNIGVDSLPLTAIVAAFIGAVTAFQTRYQLFGGVQLSVVGLISRQSVILELGPLLTGLVLTGRVGARITAELGTMRVTEQIDALETLAYDPIAYLVVPRVLAAIVMLPVLVIFADAIGVGTAFVTSIVATDILPSDFIAGLQLAYAPFQLVYSIIKATLFGAAISFFCSYEGYNASAGAEGVGRQHRIGGRRDVGGDTGARRDDGVAAGAVPAGVARPKRHCPSELGRFKTIFR